MKKAYLISTGTEFLTTGAIDANSPFLSLRLGDMGIKVVGISVVGDSIEHIQAAFLHGLEQADVVISSGGLGPTRDDLTKEIACKVMGVETVLNEEQAQKLRDFFTRYKRKMPESNLKQAMFPLEAVILANKCGTAPGMYLARNDKIVICLPGPPREMQPMFNDEVKPLLLQEFQGIGVGSVRRSIKTFGTGESQVEEMIAAVLDSNRGCTLAMLAAEGEIEIKLTAEGKTRQDSAKIMDELMEQIKPRLGNIIFGYDDDTLLGVTIDGLRRAGKTIALAESCTGGELARMLTEHPGSSKYFWGGIVVYSNEAKIKLLQIDENLLKEYGAVSAPVAKAMAENVKKIAGSDLGVGITGIAGPDGGTPDKPVGLVYIGLACGEDCRVKELRFVANRDLTRVLAAKTVLDMVRKELN